MYLEGPGLERRPVTLNAIEEVCAGAIGFPGRGSAGAAIEINVMVDADGNLARQIDGEGFRYRFSGSDIAWSLIVG